jgi:hypothetical protein
MHFADTPEKSQLEKVTQKHNHLILFINGLIQRKCVTDSELTEMLKLTTKPGEAPSSVYTRVCAANRTGFRCTECGNKFEPFQHHSGKSELCMVEECATTPVHCFIACCGKARAMSKKLQVKGGGSGSHHCGGGGLSDPE